MTPSRTHGPGSPETLNGHRPPLPGHDHESAVPTSCSPPPRAIWGTYVVTTLMLPPGIPLTVAMLRALPAGLLLLLFVRQLPRVWWRACSCWAR